MLLLKFLGKGNTFAWVRRVFKQNLNLI